MSNHTLLVVAASLVAAGCGRCDPSTLDAGEATARVGGDDWISVAATWTRPGDGVQLALGTDGAWTINLVGQTTIDGETVGAALDAGSFPIEVDLGGTSGFATMYPATGGESYSSNGLAGSLELHEAEGGALLGCFWVSAESASGDAVQADLGLFHAVEM